LQELLVLGADPEVDQFVGTYRRRLPQLKVIVAGLGVA
jgi:hypothetical protein